MSGTLADVHRWEAAAPDRVFGGVWLAPGVALPDSREFESGRVRVLGELGLRYLGSTPNDPKLEPYLALAERLGKQLMFGSDQIFVGGVVSAVLDAFSSHTIGKVAKSVFITGNVSGRIPDGEREVVEVG